MGGIPFKVRRFEPRKQALLHAYKIEDSAWEFWEIGRLEENENSEGISLRLSAFSRHCYHLH